MTTSTLTHRMYKELLPGEGEIVMTRILSVSRSSGIKVSLLEYNNIEGTMVVKEITGKKRIRSAAALGKIGDIEPLFVINATESHIELSRKRLTDEDVDDANDKWAKSKCIHSMVFMISRKLSLDITNIYSDFIWPLYDSYDHPFDAFQTLILEDTGNCICSICHETMNLSTKLGCGHLFHQHCLQTWIAKSNTCPICRGDITSNKELYLSIPLEFHECFQYFIETRIMKKETKVVSTITVSCYGIEGVHGVKKVIMDACEKYPNITIRLISSPSYEISMMTYDPDEGMETIKSITEEMNQSMKFGDVKVVG